MIGMPRGQCQLCGKSSLVSGQLGACADCIRDHPAPVMRRILQVHEASRLEFDLPAAPTCDPDGVVCRLCANECRIGEGRRGFCGLRTNRNGKLVHLDTPSARLYRRQVRGYTGRVLYAIPTKLFGRRFAEQVSEKQPPGIGADRFIGKEGIVIDQIDNTLNTGRIRIDQDVWRASSENGEIIKESELVKVIRVDGTRAIVNTFEKEEE